MSTHFDPNAAAARATSITRFRVFSRVRPFIESELEGKTSETIRSVIEMTGTKTVLLDPKENFVPKAQYDFDDSFWSIPPGYKLRHTYAEGEEKRFISQQGVYEAVAKHCAEDAFAGINTAIMSYGQTGSGKTYTMLGTYDVKKVCGGDGPEGIIPRVCHDVFQLVEAKRKEQQDSRKENSSQPEIVFSVEVTFIEIYLEKVRDLLDPALRRLKNPEESKLKEAKIRQDPESGPFVENLTKYRVENWAHCCTLLERGQAMRKTSANVVHQQSSRSHAIFTINILQQQTFPPKEKYGAPTVRSKVGRINLVDLAGSERGGFQDYVKESANINKSLLSLRCVIDKLLERQSIIMEQMKEELETGKSGPERALPAVAFRDSVLTWLLSDSMGGNARTTLIAALSPHEKNFGDTISTLLWSSRARGLVSVVKVNDTQSTVQSGLQTKVSDLSSTVKFAHQNMDELRKEMHMKEEMIESLEKGTVQLMKANIKSGAEREQHLRRNAAFVIQRVFRMALNRARERLLGQKIGAAETAVAKSKEALQNEEENKKTLAETMAAAEAVLLQESHQRAADAAELEKYHREKETFDIDYEAATRLHREGEVALKEIKEELKVEEAKQRKQTQAIVKAASEAKVRLDTMKKEIEEGQKLLEEFHSKNEEEETDKSIEAANKAAAELEARVAPLRERRNQLLAEKKLLQARLEKAKK